jgi:hypothetical protein
MQIVVDIPDQYFLDTTVGESVATFRYSDQ